MTSNGSTVAASVAEGPPKPFELDALEAEIDTIKANIQILRVGAESMHKTDPPFRVEGSKIPAPISRQSAAKAKAAGSKRGEVKAALSNTQLGPALSTNIPSPHFTPTPHSSQPSPHFAQPTQAATRRVHQTLRKDASPVKSSPESSPGKSTRAKAPDFATDKRAAQRHQKRTSLPQTWTMATPPKPESDAWKLLNDPDNAASETSAMPLSTTASGTPLANAESVEQASNISTPQKKTDAIKSSSAEQSPSGAMSRKKTSSYMSPTASAQRRKVANTGTVCPSGLSPRSHARSMKEIHPALLVGYDESSPFAPNYGGSSTSLKSGYIARRSTPEDAIERSGSAMRLPKPLPDVANTVLTRQEPDHNLLDHIKEKLGKEDLLGRHPPPGAVSHANRADNMNTTLAQMNKPMHGLSAYAKSDQVVIVADTESTAGSAYQDYSPSDGPGHVKDYKTAEDPNNDPISKLVSGLRGQSSANIGKALDGKMPQVPDIPDPAILFHGRKPVDVSISTSPRDPAIIFQARGVSNDWRPTYGQTVTLFGRDYPLPQPELESGALRATAMSFVPNAEQAQINTSWPRGPSLFHDEQPQFNQAGGIGYLQDYVDHHPAYLRYDPDYISGETPEISPVSSSSLADMPTAMDTESYSFHEGPFNPLWSYAAFPEAPPLMDPAYLQFQAGFTGGGAGIFAPYSNAAELEAPTSMQQVYGPYSGPSASEETPTFTSMSSASTLVCSSPESMDSAPQWQIQGEGRRRYQWRGGDGREIAFQGIGPDAEHDPNRPVEYRDLRTNTRVVHTNAASTPRNSGASSVSTPTAPRSMREQAKRFSDSQLPRPDDQQDGK